MCNLKCVKLMVSSKRFCLFLKIIGFSLFYFIVGLSFNQWISLFLSVEANILENVVKNDFGHRGEDPVHQLRVGGRRQVRVDGPLLVLGVALAQVPGVLAKKQMKLPKLNKQYQSLS